MSRFKSTYEIVSYGIYRGWDEKGKALPTIKSFTEHIPAELDIEFGFTLNARKAKGKCLTWSIFHPNIPDKKGRVMPPFEGEVYVRTNDWEFYLGDTIWDPIEDKLGTWRMMIECDGKVIAEKTFSVEREHGDGAIQFWKKRGY